MPTNPKEIMGCNIPTLLGSANLTAHDALVATAPTHRLTDEEQEVLGSAIYLGNLAEQRLRLEDEPLTANDAQILQDTASRGLQARGLVTVHFLPLIFSMSRKFAFDENGRFDEGRREDMTAVGSLALVAAMPGYVHISGRPFSPFAKTCVRRAMLNEAVARTRNATGLSHKMQRMLVDARAERYSLNTAGTDVTLAEAAVRLGYKPKRVELVEKLSKMATVSLDNTLFEDADSTHHKYLPDELAASMIEDAENGVLIAQIFVAAHELVRKQVITVEEWEVFSRRFGDGQTLQEIADTNEKMQKSASGVQFLEGSVIRKIRRHIENPHYYDSLSHSNLRIVESAVDLLNLLDIPVNPHTDILGTASNIIDNLRMTTWQREVMRSLLGLDEKHYRPYELAKERGRTYRAIYDAREKAIKNILSAWHEMSPYEKAQATGKQSDRPNTAPSLGPSPNTFSSRSATLRPAKFDMATVITRAVQLKPKGALTKSEVDILANKGLMPDVSTIIQEFGGWSTFQTLFKQLRQLT